MVKASKPRQDAPETELLDWPDSGSVALITWHAASGDVYEQETASTREARELLAKIRSNAGLSLVSAQVRRAGIGPDA
jgi:hypothetical protein